MVSSNAPPMTIATTKFSPDFRIVIARPHIDFMVWLKYLTHTISLGNEWRLVVKKRKTLKLR